VLYDTDMPSVSEAPAPKEAQGEGLAGSSGIGA
jgi:hypothetical protein